KNHASSYVHTRMFECSFEQVEAFVSTTDLLLFARVAEALVAEKSATSPRTTPKSSTFILDDDDPTAVMPTEYEEVVREEDDVHYFTRSYEPTDAFDFELYDMEGLIAVLPTTSTSSLVKGDVLESVGDVSTQGMTLVVALELLSARDSTLH